MTLTMSLGNLNETNGSLCSVYETEAYVIVALVSAVSATVSLVACIAVVFLIVTLKKYIFFVQRLILYLCVAALLNSITVATRFQQVKDLETHTNTEALDKLCAVTAFFEQLTSWSITIAFSCVTFNLLLTAVFKRGTEKLEPLYFVLIYFLPITFNWVPFLQDGYGEAGAWCWIRGLNDDCTTFYFGTYLRYIMWYVPGAILVTATVVTYLFIVAWVTWKRYRWVGKYDPETERLRENMHKEVWPLLFYPLGYLLLNIFSLINRIQDTVLPGQPVYALWILHALTSPLQGGYIALNYILSKDSRKSFSCKKIRATLCLKEATIYEYPVDTGATDSWSEKRIARS